MPPKFLLNRYRDTLLEDRFKEDIELVIEILFVSMLENGSLMNGRWKISENSLELIHRPTCLEEPGAIPITFVEILMESRWPWKDSEEEQ